MVEKKLKQTNICEILYDYDGASNVLDYDELKVYFSANGAFVGICKHDVDSCHETIMAYNSSRLWNGKYTVLAFQYTPYDLINVLKITLDMWEDILSMYWNREYVVNDFEISYDFSQETKYIMLNLHQEGSLLGSMMFLKLLRFCFNNYLTSMSSASIDIESFKQYMFEKYFKGDNFADVEQLLFNYKRYKNAILNICEKRKILYEPKHWNNYHVDHIKKILNK